MKSANKVLLFDIDYTLFDTDLYIKKYFPLLAKEMGISNLKEFYNFAKEANLKSREIAGFFDPGTFLKLLIKISKKDVKLEKLEELFFKNKFYAESFYEDTIEVLKKLSKNKQLIVGVLSTGHDNHQRQKIMQLNKFFNDENIHIFPDKIIELKNVLGKYKDKEIYIVDDLLMVLKEVKTINNNAHTIWIKRKIKHEKRAEENLFIPDYTFTNISDILSVLK